MMALRTLRTFTLALGLGLVVPACASIGPSPELITARNTYAEATAPGTPVSAGAVLESQRALNAAEVEDSQTPLSDQERHLAYIATRKAQISMVRGRTDVTRSQADRASTEYNAMLEARAKADQMAAAKARGERDLAVATLMKFAEVNDTGETLSIALNGTVLFATDQVTLLPIARHSLDQVADAIKHIAPKQPIQIIGFADSTGDAAYNAKLSLARAQAVRDYLIAKGVSGDNIAAVGKGEADPVANNDSAEGRANNRRVEIMIPHEQTARR